MHTPRQPGALARQGLTGLSTSLILLYTGCSTRHMDATPEQEFILADYDQLLQYASQMGHNFLELPKAYEAYLEQHPNSPQQELVEHLLSEREWDAEQARLDLIGTWHWEATGRPAYSFNEDGSCVFFTSGVSLTTYNYPSPNDSNPVDDGCWADTTEISYPGPALKTLLNEALNHSGEIVKAVNCLQWKEDHPRYFGHLLGAQMLAPDRIVAPERGRQDFFYSQAERDTGNMLVKSSDEPIGKRTCFTPEDRELQRWEEAEEVW